MWLINTFSLDLKEFIGKPPDYAILSHRWGSNKKEVSFREWQEDHTKFMTRPGYIKITKACEQARKNRLRYLWVDTNCIDKTSSAELSEAINSMYQYYEEAQVCFTYLQDVSSLELDLNGPSPLDSEFAKSSWFTRGWTLQELLAPTNLVFYNTEWVEIGTKSQLKDLISQITGIGTDYLNGLSWVIREATICCRMSWVSNRDTTRLEDIAYCMLGIFDINMSLLYGERHRAFERLQVELINSSNDQTLFAWDWLPPTNMNAAGRRAPSLRISYLSQLGWGALDPYAAKNLPPRRTSILAPDPVLFYNSEGCPRVDSEDHDLKAKKPYTMTHLGLSISLHFHRSRHYQSPSAPSLALISPYRSYDVVDSHGHAWIGCYGFELSILDTGQTRIIRSKDNTTAGSLLSIKTPSDLFFQCFPITDMFIPDARWYNYGAVEAPIELGVWCLKRPTG